MAKKAPAKLVKRTVPAKKSAPEKKAAPAKKVAPAKKIVDKKSKDIKKADKSAKPKKAEPPAPVLSRAASKKDIVEPKLAKKVSAKTDRVLDLCLLLDCTGSMASWI